MTDTQQMWLALTIVLVCGFMWGYIFGSSRKISASEAAKVMRKLQVQKGRKTNEQSTNAVS